MILRELFAKLGLKTDEASFAKGQLAVEGIKAGLGFVVDKAKEVSEQFIEAVKSTAEYGDNLEGLAQSAGVTTDALQRIQKAASIEGMAIEETAGSLVMLTRGMAAAAKGEGDQAAAFRRMGIAVRDAHGRLRSAGDVFADLIPKFSAMEDGADKTHLALELFGRSGAKMIPVLNNGEEALAAMNKAAVMSPEQIRAGKEMVIVQRQLAAQTKLLWRSAVAPLLPAITDLLKQFLAWKKANAEVMKQRIQAFLGYAVAGVKLLGKALKVAIDVVAFFTQNLKWLALILGPVLAGMALKAAVEALASLTLGMAKAGVAAVWAAAKTAAAWAVAVLPFAAIAAAVTALLLLFDDLEGYATGKDSLFGRFQKQIAEWAKPHEGDPWWLRAVKELVRSLERVYELAADLEINGNAKPGQKQSALGMISRRAMQGTFEGLGIEAPQFIRNAWARQQAAEQATGSFWSGLGAGMRYGTGTPGNVTVNVNGGDPAEVKRAVGQALDERGVIGTAQLEEAAAAVPGG